MESRFNRLVNIIKTDIKNKIEGYDYEQLYDLYDESLKYMKIGDKKQSKIKLLKEKKVDKENYIYNELLINEILELIDKKDITSIDIKKLKYKNIFNHLPDYEDPDFIYKISKKGGILL